MGRGERLLHLSPEQSLASISAASGGASATEWEQNGPDCEGREALARDQMHPKPPLILQCAAELGYSPTRPPNTCLVPFVQAQNAAGGERPRAGRELARATLEYDGGFCPPSSTWRYRRGSAQGHAVNNRSEGAEPHLTNEEF